MKINGKKRHKKYTAAIEKQVERKTGGAVTLNTHCHSKHSLRKRRKYRYAGGSLEVFVVAACKAELTHRRLKYLAKDYQDSLGIIIRQGSL